MRACSTLADTCDALSNHCCLCSDEEAELLGICEWHFPFATDANAEPSAACSPIPPPSLKCLELPAMRDVVPGRRFIESLSRQSDSFFEHSIAASDFLECALSSDRCDNAIAWMSALELKDSNEWGVCAEEYPAINHYGQAEETIKSDQGQHQKLKKIKHDGAALQVPVSYLRTASASVLKKVVRKNAASVLIQEPDKMDFFKIPQVAQVAIHSWNPWEFSFAEISSDSAVKSSSDPQMQQLMMPSRLSHEDEKKPNDAVMRVIDLGKQILQMIHSSSASLPPRPLTSIMLNIPSLWSLEIVSDGAATRFREVFEWKQTLDKAEETILDDAGKLKSCSSKEDEIVKHPSETTSEIKIIAEETKKAAETPLAAEVQQPRMMLLMPDAGPTTTEDLVSGFFGATANQLVIAEQKAASTSATFNAVEEVRMDRHKRLPIEHLARPVLWDLARKKVIRVDPNSVQCALEALSLEFLESIIFQQQANVKKISRNPSAFSHEAIFDACTSFRQSTWLHTLR